MSFNAIVSSINGDFEATLPLTDRGLAYGYGVFETIRVSCHSPVQLEFHLARLALGAERLKIPLSEESVTEYLNTFLQRTAELGESDGVAKLIVTAGFGGRGYSLPTQLEPLIIWQWFPLPTDIIQQCREGVSLKYCEHRLGGNLPLVGIKHLNRLDQILARAEWHDDQYQEGLMLNHEGMAIECISSNLFIVEKNKVLTPALINSGVAGVMRREIIESLCPSLEIPVEVVNLLPQQIENADEVFITNALYGIRPVACIETMGQFSIGNVTKSLQRELGRQISCFQA